MKTQPTENLQKEGRTPDGRFAPGHTGNPKGRAPGSRNKATQAALALMEGQLEQITQTLVDAALGGDLTAIRLILERLVPPCKEKALPPISLPPVPDAQSLPKLTAAILGAVADGCITPGEGQALAALASTHAKNLELAELEQRIAALERTQGKGRP
ncbi:DUF5681 domain-containing protein [Desulfovibrio legallii]|jgi:hypothetical protein|uniref:DUF5681 domain-containing protein n=1 Tax=Desulfovibrio legallii TaxID=571438 RepID=A0A6H3FFC4_9BACT|nr:DUF5681 domain-containing protein [Desulfovibrio legallii]TBH80988.1 hypothetical protein EB812_02540 [Desulfovibrio legallii]